MSTTVHLLGIRHHGPGSTRNVLEKLTELQPDCLLIELPEQCSSLLKDAQRTDLLPPVAMLLYNPKNLEEASFYPFTAFSPEWQAMRFGGSRGIEMRAFDLPYGVSPRPASANLAPHSTLLPTDSDDESDAALMLDPFDAIAKMDGYSDSERWWEAKIERQQSEKDTFEVIIELMTALRDSKSIPETDETLLREAFMRQQIRQAQKDGYQNIAVICGAWHTPELTSSALARHTKDAVIMKGLKKPKMETTWIPWSFERMTIRSGYRAGVHTPAWYQALHTHGPDHALVRWMSEAVQLLRTQDIPVSSAHAIEAIRLAQALAVLRHTAIPGITELRDAAISILCIGNEKMLQTIEEQLIVGDLIGTVPHGLNSSPIKADFEDRVREARMKVQSQKSTLTLDLREAAHIKKSVLLHQLYLLGLQWGVEQKNTSNLRKGGWHEDWELLWMPEFELKWIEISPFGSTILDAAQSIALHRIKELASLNDAVQILSAVLKADLAHLSTHVLTKIQALSIGTSDTLTLASVILPLAEIGRYGSARNFNTQVLVEVIDDLLPRVCVQLPNACLQVDEETAAEVSKAILQLNRAVHFPAQAGHKGIWLDALRHIAKHQLSAPACQGLAYRLLFDQNQIQITEVTNALSQLVSAGQEPYQAALWLEGFLQGNALMLIHHEPFFAMLDQWLSNTQTDDFKQALPVLRRAFGAFSEPERQQITRLALQKHETTLSSTYQATDWDEEQAADLLKANDWLFE